MSQRVALSWSGGKDSCMALHKLVEGDKKVACLVTTVPQETGRTFAHDEEIGKMKAQAEALDIPIEFIHCSYDTYNEDFLKHLLDLKTKYELNAIAFGDIYLEGHREWGEKLATAAGIQALYPLWMEESMMLDALNQFIKLGYKAEVIKVRGDMLPQDWVGRILDKRFIEEISKKADICPMGESGEYHTFVFDGPLFKERVNTKGL
ncbi:diphthine--ammonia ligase [Siminovitchia sp. FSL H7-0308]|uniref:Dph6-related ATP pyrophosphatase n=1 Tax=Siminovitchia sp. FSL H7-0308 TaxID=2921432 RepID=UPI0030EC3E95